MSKDRFENPIEVIITLSDPAERSLLSDALREHGFAPLICSSPAHAEAFFRLCVFRTRLVIFEADVFGMTLLDNLLGIVGRRGYEFHQRFWGLSSRMNDVELRYELNKRGAEFYSKSQPMDLITDAQMLQLMLRREERPQFKVVHHSDRPFDGRCVAGEVPTNLSLRFGLSPWIPAPSSETPLLFADAILKFSSESAPKTASRLLRLMAMDPFYTEAIAEEYLNKRNFITNWYRIKEEIIGPVLKKKTEEHLVSRATPGREHVYYFRGECIVKHKMNTALMRGGALS